MSKSFYDFSKEKRYSNQANEQNFGQGFKNQTSKNQSTYDNISDAVNKYSQMSQDELMQNLLFEVQKQKQNGTFDVNRLENAVDSLGAYLTPQQKKNIKEILNSLK